MSGASDAQGRTVITGPRAPGPPRHHPGPLHLAGLLPILGGPLERDARCANGRSPLAGAVAVPPGDLCPSRLLNEYPCTRVEPNLYRRVKGLPPAVAPPGARQVA